MTPLQRRPSTQLVRLCGWLLVITVALEIGLLVFGPAGIESETATMLRRGGLAAAVGLAAMAGFDLYAIARMKLPTVKRIIPANLALHDWSEVRVEVSGNDSIQGRFQIYDDLPSHSDSEGLPLEINAARDPSMTCAYRLRPNVRGDAAFGAFMLAAHSPMGLWRFTVPCGEEAIVRVYPNFSAVARYDSLQMDQHTAEVGIRLRQRRGEGMEFHQLREYRDGDSLRQIDWKATSRKQELISREYQDERDQRVIFLLDCGRRMRAKDGDLSHFDHALNTMVLLAHVALRTGDAVGLLSFGEANRWLPAKKGISTVNRILNATYDLETSTLGSDFSGAAEELRQRQPRRSLVILLTSVRSEDTEDLLLGLELLKRHHLVLVVNLRESRVDEVIQQPITDFRGALRYLGAWQHVRARRLVQDSLQEEGVLTLDVNPDEVSAQLINRYYAIKRTGVL